MSIQYKDSRAVELREWLNSRYKFYVENPVTDSQLSHWLDEAERSEGIVEIRAQDCVSGRTETYRLDL